VEHTAIAKLPGVVGTPTVHGVFFRDARVQLPTAYALDASDIQAGLRHNLTARPKHTVLVFAPATEATGQHDGTGYCDTLNNLTNAAEHRPNRMNSSCCGAVT
jgi:hypothetical protein